jgi:kinesin family protein 3/17
MSSEETVRVIVRCRPLNSREKALNCDVCVKTMTEAGQVQLIKPGAAAADEPPKKFTFDGAYGIDSNSQVRCPWPRSVFLSFPSSHVPPLSLHTC